MDKSRRNFLKLSIAAIASAAAVKLGLADKVVAEENVSARAIITRYENTLVPNGELSEQSLNEMILAINRMKSDRGERIGFTPTRMVVHPSWIPTLSKHGIV